MKISIGADHGGFYLREHLLNVLRAASHEVIDQGAHSYNPSDDYPDFAQAVGEDIANKRANFGILICTSGIGMSICANKIPGVRAALIHHTEDAKVARRHNNANILVLSGRYENPESAAERVECFIHTAFEGGRHARRLDRIESIQGSPTTSVCR